MSIVVRAPVAGDEPGWRVLWAGYNRFYRAAVPEPVTVALWSKLLVGGAWAGFVASQDGALVGLAHTLLHESSWSLQPSCYLEDLFVAREARGGDVGQALIEAAGAAARARGADRLYWHTQEFNGAARSLYDTLAERTSFITYRQGLDKA